jgi:RNA 2',3'-cyclic 3'-phosphodiesterase
LRLFAAVEIDEPVRIAAADASERLRARLLRKDLHIDARWVAADHLHITIWFIGEVDEARAAVIVSAMQQPFPCGPFDLHLSGFGAFPPNGAPRVLWLGVRTGQEGLRALHAETGARLRPLGFEAERRPYSGHVTVARVKDAPRASARMVQEVLAGTPADAGQTRVKAVTLFRSRVSSKGSTYEPIARAPLKAQCHLG